MKFWASAEVHKDAYLALDRVKRCVEAYLNTKFEQSSLNYLNIELRYIPFVMDGEFRSHVKSGLNKSTKSYCCTENLNFSIYVNGSISEQVSEYTKGISIPTNILFDFGATQTQVNDIGDIMDNLEGEILRIMELQ